MNEPELTVRDLTPPTPACDSRRHHAHPSDTCEEFEELRAAFVAFVSDCLLHGTVEAERRLLEGDGTGEARGFRAAGVPREPSPVERALAILDPHLRACPLYTAGPPAIYPTTRRA